MEVTKPKEKDHKSEDPAATPVIDTDRYLDIVDDHVDYFTKSIEESKARGNNADPFQEKADTYMRINSVLQRFKGDGEEPAKYLDLLKRALERQEQKPTEKRSSYNNEEISGLREAIAFIEDDLRSPEKNDKLRAAYLSRKADAAQKRISEMAAADKTESAERIEEIRDDLNPEKEEGAEKSESELLKQIIEQGGAVLTASYPPQLRSDEKSGFASLPDRKMKNPSSTFNSAAQVSNTLQRILGTSIQEFQIDRSSPEKARAQRERRGLSLDQVLKLNDLAEIMYSQSLTSPVTEKYKEIETIKTGLFKKEQKEIERTRVTGERPTTVGEVLDYPSDEPAVKIFYATATDENYRDYSNRSGQCLKMELTLPKSIADRVMAAAKANPAFIHRIIDQVALEDFSIPKESWTEGKSINGGFPLRPPFEAWAKSGKKAYVADGNDVQYYDQDLADFNASHIKEY